MKVLNIEYFHKNIIFLRRLLIRLIMRVGGETKYSKIISHKYFTSHNLLILHKLPYKFCLFKSA